jgi:hypothetical protein
MIHGLLAALAVCSAVSVPARADARGRPHVVFVRIIFAGDRGMVTAENLESLQRDHHGFLVGLNRRRNAELRGWLDLIDETKWINCPIGITAQERKTDPPRTRAQEVTSGDPGMRVIIVDSY